MAPPGRVGFGPYPPRTVNEKVIHFHTGIDAWDVRFFQSPQTHELGRLDFEFAPADHTFHNDVFNGRFPYLT